MPGPELLWTLGVLAAIAAFTLALTIVTVKSRRAGDAARRALRATDIAAECRDLLLGPEFLWGVWLDTDKAAAMTLLIRDAQDSIVATVVKPNVVPDGVLMRFELAGRHYAVHKDGLFAGGRCLVEAGHDTVLLSARHDSLNTRFFRGKDGQPMADMPQVSVFQRWRPLRAGDAEIGRLVVGLERHDSVGVLTLPPGRHTTLEQVFVLASA